MPLRQRRWNQTAGAAGGRQPGLVGGELLEREPFAAGGFEAGDVLLGSAAGGCRGLLLGGGVLVWSVRWPQAAVLSEGTGSAGARGAVVHGG